MVKSVEHQEKIFLHAPQDERDRITDAVKFEDIAPEKYGNELQHRYDAFYLVLKAEDDRKHLAALQAYDSRRDAHPDNAAKSDPKKPAPPDTKARLNAWIHAASEDAGQRLQEAKEIYDPLFAKSLESAEKADLDAADAARRNMRGMISAKEPLSYFSESLIEAAEASIPQTPPLTGEALTKAVSVALGAQLSALDPQSLAEDGRGTSAFAAVFMPDAAHIIAERIEAVRNVAAPNEAPAVPNEAPVVRDEKVETDSSKKDAAKGKKNEASATKKPMSKEEYEAGETAGSKAGETFASVDAIYLFITESQIGSAERREQILAQFSHLAESLPGPESNKLLKLTQGTVEKQIRNYARNLDKAETRAEQNEAANSFTRAVMKDAQIDMRNLPTQKNLQSNAIVAGVAAAGLLALGSTLQGHGTHTEKLMRERAREEKKEPDSTKIVMQKVVVGLGIAASITAIGLAIGSWAGNPFSLRVGANISHVYRKVTDAIGVGSGPRL